MEPHWSEAMTDFQKLVHERFPEIPWLTPRRRVCFYGNPADACPRCAKRRNFQKIRP